MTNTPAQNKQTAQQRRYEDLADLLTDPVDDVSILVDRVYAYLDAEVRAAYGRGFRDGQRPRGQERSQGDRRPGEFRSAVAAGVLRPVHREGA